MSTGQVVPRADQQPVVRLKDASLRIDGKDILQDVTLDIGRGEFWVVLGRNGAGKTSLLRLAGGQRVPSSGDVSILGETSGRTDLRRLRADIALVSETIENRIRPELTTLEVVLAGKDGSLVPWWQDHSDADRDKAARLLAQVELDANDIAKRFGALSTGERKRAMLARALMSGSRLLLLDEPLAGLDLGAREHLLEVLCEVFISHAETAILVTHHLEEIPPIASHAALVAGGQVTRSGRVGDVITSRHVSECFGRTIDVRHEEGRWYARAAKADDGRQLPESS